MRTALRFRGKRPSRPSIVATAAGATNSLLFLVDAPGISEKDENRSKSTKVTKVTDTQPNGSWLTVARQSAFIRPRFEASTAALTRALWLLPTDRILPRTEPEE